MKPALEKRLEVLRANLNYLDNNRAETEALSAKVKALSRRLNSSLVGSFTSRSLAVVTSPYLLGIQLALYSPDLGCFNGQDKAPYYVEQKSNKGQCEPYLNQAGLDLLSDNKSVENERKRNPQYLCDYVNNLYDHVIRGSAALAKYKPTAIQVTSCQQASKRSVIQIEYELPNLEASDGSLTAPAVRETATLEHQNGRLIKATRLHPNSPQRDASILEFDDGILRRVQTWTGENRSAASRFGGPEYLVRSPDYTPAYDLIGKYSASLKPAPTSGENVNRPAVFWQQIAPFVEEAIAKCNTTSPIRPTAPQTTPPVTAVK